MRFEPQATALACVGAVAVLFAATAIRGAALNRQSLWTDEVSTLIRISKPDAATTVRDLWTGTHGYPANQPPLHYLLLYGWSCAWGKSDLALRAFPFAASAVSILAVGPLFYRLIGKPAAGLLALLVASSAYHMHYGGDAKMYALLWLFACASHAACLHTLSRSPKPFWTGLYVASTACSLMTSYTALLLPVTQGAFVILLGACRLLDATTVRRTFGLILVSLAPVCVWFLPMANAMHRQSGIEWIPEVTLADLPRGIADLLSVFLTGVRSPMYEGAICSPLLNLGYVVLCLTGLLIITTAARLWTSRSGAPIGANAKDLELTWLYAMFVIGATVIGCGLFSVTVYSLWHVPRYLTAMAPLVPLLLACCATLTRTLLAAVTVAAVVAVNLGVAIHAHTVTTRTPWRDLASAIVDSSFDEDRELERFIPVVPFGDYVHGGRSPCLQHAFNGIFGSERVFKTTFSDLDRETGAKRPFYLLTSCFGGDPCQLPASLTRDYHVKRLLTRRLHEDRTFTAMPSPCVTRTVELWHCRPKSAQTMEATPDVSRPASIEKRRSVR